MLSLFGMSLQYSVVVLGEERGLLIHWKLHYNDGRYKGVKTISLMGLEQYLSDKRRIICQSLYETQLIFFTGNLRRILVFFHPELLNTI
jgi:hypothetical protein